MRWLKSESGGKLSVITILQELHFEEKKSPLTGAVMLEQLRDEASALATGVPKVAAARVAEAACSLRAESCAVTVQRVFRRWKWRRFVRRMTEREEHRRHCANEILTTEVKYVEQLGILVDLLMNPLVDRKKDDVLNVADIKVLFSDVAVIKAVNESLLATLTERVAHWSRMQKLGDIFIKMSDYLRVYTDYVKNYFSAQRLLSSFTESHPFTKFYEQQIKKAPEAYWRFPPESLLITPVQRIPRYRLLLDDLLRHTDADHPDFTDLTEACKKIASIAEWVNENQRKSEKQGKVIEFQHLVVGIDEELVAASRSFVHEGEVVELAGKKLRRRFAILFNDMLVVCDPKKTEGSLFSKKTQTKYQFYLKIRLETAVLENIPDSDVHLNAFRIHYNGQMEHLLLCTQTAEEKAKWVKEISAAISLIAEQTKEKEEKKQKVATSKAEAVAAILSQQYATLKYTGQPLSRALSEVSSAGGGGGGGGGGTTSLPGTAPATTPAAATAATATAAAPSTSLDTSASGKKPPGSPVSASMSRRQMTFFSMNAMDKWKIAEEAKDELDKLKNLSKIAEMMQQQRAIQTAERNKALLMERYQSMAESGVPSSIPLAAALADPGTADGSPTKDQRVRSLDRGHAKTITTGMHVPQRFSFGRRVTDDLYGLDGPAPGTRTSAGIAPMPTDAMAPAPTVPRAKDDLATPGSRASISNRTSVPNHTFVPTRPSVPIRPPVTIRPSSPLSSSSSSSTSPVTVSRQDGSFVVRVESEDSSALPTIIEELAAKATSGLAYTEGSPSGTSSSSSSTAKK